MQIDNEYRLQTRAAYLGKPPESYIRLNHSNFPELRRDTYPHSAAQQEVFLSKSKQQFFAAARARFEYPLFANENGTEVHVKVIPLPFYFPDSLCKNAIHEMITLREQGLLTSLRGNRSTDLARPLPTEVREQVNIIAPNLVKLVTGIEKAIKGSDLFVRAIKIDEARISTTTGSK